jgi:hypothetical protein
MYLVGIIKRLSNQKANNSIKLKHISLIITLLFSTKNTAQSAVYKEIILFTTKINQLNMLKTI